ncbi:CTP synthase [Nematocida sp. AWRm77]|nr:CTP synthase [Nematocida sp. AWRm77]
MKYILVCGGVISGVGKGVVASSVGKILKEKGYEVTVIKVDPYLNFDAGTLGPRDHGEVFVLDDGTETDLDLGNYERFLGVNLTKLNSITSGRMYQEVINKERKGEYLGKTVQVVPHLTDHIKHSIKTAACIPVDADGVEPKVCIIELGGVVGDIESTMFIEALRQLLVESKRDSFMVIGVDYALELNEEHKTKPIQASAKRARELGIAYDLIVCRSERPISEEALKKIVLFTGVEKYIELPDCQVLDVPNKLIESGMLKYVQKRLDLPEVKASAEKQVCFNKITVPKQKVCKVAIVGKYSNHEDAYLSIKESLKFAGSYSELLTDVNAKYFDTSMFVNKKNLSKLKEFSGIIIPGGFGKRGIEEMVLVAQYARENKIPLLGICLGLQIIAIEYARNVMGIHNATSEELVKEEDVHTIIDDKINHINLLPSTETSCCIIRKHSNKIRIGKQSTNTVLGTKIAKIYGSPKGEEIFERYRHRYGISKEFAKKMKGTDLKVCIQTDVFIDGLELDNHPFYVGVQFHPEFLSKPAHPRPLFICFLSACLNNTTA